MEEVSPRIAAHLGELLGLDWRPAHRNDLDAMLQAHEERDALVAVQAVLASAFRPTLRMRTNARLKAGATKDNLELHRFEKKHDLHSNARKHLELYYYMRLNRELEEQMVRLFRQNKIVGGLYSSFGQEAISVGTAYALGPGDWIAPLIRNIGALLVRGFKPRDILTQHMARYTSPTLGKDGTSHFGELKSRQRRLADFHAGRPDPGHDGHRHGGTLPRPEDCDHDVDRRRRDLHRRVPRRIESGGGAEGPSRTDRGK